MGYICSKGFGLVQYSSREEANVAIEGMDGKFLHGRVIFVAKPKFENKDDMIS